MALPVVDPTVHSEAGATLGVVVLQGGIDETLNGMDTHVVEFVVALVLGLFLGLEREWSQKDAGIRTFALLSLLGAILTVFGEPLLLATGGLLVLVMGVLLAVRSLVGDDAETGLSLTTSVSMFVAYGVGVLVVSGFFLESVTVAVLSSLLLVLKRELHQFAWALSREEVRSATEFAIIAFVVYPLLPRESFGPWNAVDPRTVWLLVIAVSGIGFVNYVMLRRYEAKGIAVTGFFGGLVNSTAVVAELTRRFSGGSTLRAVAVGSILLANAAMALRNAIIVVPFVPDAALLVAVPLGAMTVAGVLLSTHVADWDRPVETDLASPFSLSSALAFGVLFLVILVGTAGAQATFGTRGFLTSTFLAGFVSSGTATATAVALASAGQVPVQQAMWGVLAGTLSSILVKIGLAAVVDRSLLVPAMLWNGVLIAVGLASALVVLFG